MIQGKYEGCKQFGRMFNARVNGTNYGFGPKDPADLGIEPGDTISFEVTQNGKFTNADVNTVQIVSKASSQTSNNQSSGSKNSSEGMNKGDYWENKAQADAERQTIIEHQSSRNAAITTVEMLIQNGLVTLPKQADRYDFALNLIERVTNKYNTQLENVRQFGLPCEEAEQGDAAQEADELDK